MNPNLLKFAAGIIGLALWAWLAFLKLTPVEPLIDLLKMALGGLVVHMLQSDGVATSSPAPAAAPPGQAGYASLWLLGALACFCLMFAGCTTTTASMYSGLYTQAKAGVMVFDDNAMKTARDILCAQPYSAVQRNSDMQAGIQTLCGPLANTASLDANQLAMLMSILKGTGVKLEAAAAPAAAASAAK